MRSLFKKHIQLTCVMVIAFSGLAEAVTVDGTVRDPGGNGIAGIEVSLFRDSGGGSWSLLAFRSTSSTGSWSMTEVPAGRYRLKVFDWAQRYAYEFFDNVSFFDDATDIEIATDDLTIDVTVEPGGTISGTVSTPGGAPLENPAVVAFDINGELLYYESIFGTSYEVGGLPTGEYLLRFTGGQLGSDQQWDYFQEWYDDAPEQDLATPVPVTAGAQTGDIDAFMGYDSGGSITGTVMDLYDHPYTSARIEAWQEEDGEWQIVRGVDTGAYYYDGEFTLDLPPGTYRLRFEGSTSYNLANSLVEWWPDAASLDEAENVVLELDATLHIDGVLGELAPGSIAGRITDQQDDPLEGIEVSIRGFSGELYRHFTRTDVDGAYLIEGLQPDSYLIELFDPTHEHRWTYLGGTQNPGLADLVEVTSTAVTGINQSLSPGVDPGSLTGFVTDPMGNPAPGVRVLAVATADPFDWLSIGVVRGDGSYRLRDLPTGNVLVEFSDPRGAYVEEWYDNVPSENEATPVAVFDGAATSGVSAVLDTAGGIAGEVVNTFGHPFTLTTINAYSFDGESWVPAGSTFAFEESAYLLAGLPPGVYRVVFAGGGWWGPRETEWYDDAPSLELATDVVVVDGEITDDINAVLGSGPGGSISGTVTDGEGNPVEAVEVQLYDEYLSPRDAGAVTGADGRYTVEPLYSGLYYVEFSDPGGRPGEFFDDAEGIDVATPVLVSGDPVEGVDAVLDGAGPGPGGGAIAGTVTDGSTGLGIAGVRVSCFATDLVDHPPCMSTTAPDGTYLLGGNLPTASYLVRFWTPSGDYVTEYFDDVPTAAQATPVAVEIGLISTGVDAEMTGAGAISGTVTDAAGNPLAKLLVTAFQAVDGEWRQVTSTMTFYEPQYELSGLEAGIYRIRFADGYEGFFSESEFWDDSATVEAADDVTVVVGETTGGIDAILREELPGGIGGRVTNSSETPAPAIEVSIFDAFGDVVAQGQTGADGRYEILNLLPGWYWVGFEDPAGELPSEHYADAATLDMATPLQVGYSLAPDIDAVLDGPGGQQGGAAVEGRVTDPAGQPLSGIEVQCFSVSGFAVGRCSDVTGPNGEYRLGGFLPPEPVVVRFEDPNGSHVAEWFDNVTSFVDASPLPLAPGATLAGIDASLEEGPALRNPSFDHDLEGWTIDAPQGAAVAHSPIDAHGDVDSGSARIATQATPDGVVALEQCLAADSSILLVGGRVRIESVGQPTASVVLTPFADESCGGRSSQTSIRHPVTEGDTSTLWRDIEAELEVPDGTGSIMLRFEIHAAGAESFDAYWDALYVAPSNGRVFSGGFETGTLVGWSGQ